MGEFLTQKSEHFVQYWPLLTHQASVTHQVSLTYELSLTHQLVLKNQVSLIHELSFTQNLSLKHTQSIIYQLSLTYISKTFQFHLSLTKKNYSVSHPNEKVLYFGFGPIRGVPTDNPQIPTCIFKI